MVSLVLAVPERALRAVVFEFAGNAVALNFQATCKAGKLPGREADQLREAVELLRTALRPLLRGELWLPYLILPKISQLPEMPPTAREVWLKGERRHPSLRIVGEALYVPAEAILRHNPRPVTTPHAAQILSAFFRASKAIFSYVPAEAPGDVHRPNRLVGFSIVFTYAGLVGVIENRPAA
jgi:hypothetical protein